MKQILKSGAVYFAIVFGVGFILGGVSVIFPILVRKQNLSALNTAWIITAWET